MTFTECQKMEAKIMYCKTCGAEMNENQVICLNCGCAKGTGSKFCANCGKELTENAFACLNCGVAADFGAQNAKSGATGIPGLDSDGWCPAGKEKIVAILLAFFIGGFGIHNFYLGETKKGLLRLCTSWLFIGSILALIDFIKMLIGSYKYDPDALI